MSDMLFTVEEAAARLKLHPKTILRYIRDRRLPASRVGKSYRIERSDLDALAGIADERSDAASQGRATCIVDIPEISAHGASHISAFLNAAAMSGEARTKPLHIDTAFDPDTRTLKLVLIGGPGDVSGLLDLLAVHQGNQQIPAQSD